MNSTDKVRLINKINKIEDGLWHLKCDVDFGTDATTMNEKADQLIEQMKALLQQMRYITRDTRAELLRETLSN